MAVNMPYQDMFRVRERSEVGMVLDCMHRISGFSFNRSIKSKNLGQF